VLRQVPTHTETGLVEGVESHTSLMFSSTS
jgi:hypothetical protein